MNKVNIHVRLLGMLVVQLSWAQSALVAQPSQVQAHDRPSPISLPFVAKNDPKQWAVAAEITGTVESDGEVLRIFVKTCSLFRPERFSDPVTLASIVSGVARQRPGDTWEIERSSDRHPTTSTLSPGDQVELEPFELVIPLERLDIRHGDWLTFEIFNTYFRQGQKHGAYVPVYARIQWPDSLVLSTAQSPGPARYRARADPAASRIAGEIGGTISRESETLAVKIDSGSLYSSDEYPEGDRKLSTIQAVISRPLDGKQTIERGSPTYAINQTLKPGSKIALGPLELKISFANYAKYPTDRIDLRIIWTNSEGRLEVEHLHIRYELPDGQNPPLSRTLEVVANRPPDFLPPPAVDPQPISRDLRAAIRSSDLVAAADLAAKLDSAVQQQLNAWFTRDARERVDEVLTWLPVDTESIWVNQEPLTITPTAFELSREHPIIQESVDRLAALDEGKYYRALGGRLCRLLIAAGRNLSGNSNSRLIGPGDVMYFYFLDAPAELGTPGESIHGKPSWKGVAKVDSGAPFRPGVERTTRDDENWIALARPDLMVVTNSRDLLSEVLARIVDGSQARALPPSLPEWNQVDRRASVWGLRHYRDSTKPKAGEQGFSLAELPRPDGRATGVAIQFYSARERVEMRYMSAAPLASHGPGDSVYREFKVDQPQTGVWRLVSDIGQRGDWPLYFALEMLGFGRYR